MKYTLLLRTCLACFFIIACLQLYSCRSPETEKKAAAPEYAMTEDTIYSASSQMKALIPIGWTPGETNELDFWLIKNDFSASIACTEVRLPGNGIFIPSADSLRPVMQYCISQKHAAADTLYESETAVPGGRRFGIYKYRTNDGRVVHAAVFKYAGKYFEISAVQSPGVKGNDNELGKALRAVMESVK